MLPPLPKNLVPSYQLENEKPGYISSIMSQIGWNEKKYHQIVNSSSSAPSQLILSQSSNPGLIQRTSQSSVEQYSLLFSIFFGEHIAASVAASFKNHKPSQTTLLAVVLCVCQGRARVLPWELLFGMYPRKPTNRFLSQKKISSII